MIEGNYVGTDATGSIDLGNRTFGVKVQGSGNTVGGTVVAARNVVSGNDNVGLSILPGGSGGNAVQGNFIGTDATGTAKIPNAAGIRTESESTSTTPTFLGGANAGAGNLVSGNGSGIVLGGTLIGSVIQGNLIGRTRRARSPSATPQTASSSRSARAATRSAERRRPRGT